VQRSEDRSTKIEAAHSALLGTRHNALGSGGRPPNLRMSLASSLVADSVKGHRTPTKPGLRESDSARTSVSEAGTFLQRFD
jgi:hypothetical protein